MSETTGTPSPPRDESTTAAGPALRAGRVFDGLILGLTVLFVLGGYLLARGDPDGTAASEPFLGPPALLVYLGAIPAILLLARAAASGRSRGAPWRDAIADGYQAALVGALLFAVGLLLALLFRPDTGAGLIDTLTWPGNLLLFAGGALIASGPLLGFGRRWSRTLPAGTAGGAGTPGDPGGGRGRRAALDGGGLALSVAVLLAIPMLLVAATHPLVTGADDADLTGDGPTPRTDLYRIPVESGRAVRLTVTLDEDEVHPAVSPDGLRIVVGRGELGLLDAWLLDADGRDLARITGTDGANEDGFTWSPDGTRLAWWSDLRDDPGAAGEGDTGASAAPEPPPQPDSPVGPPALSGYVVDTWVASPDGSGATRLALPQSNEGIESWSPDGTRLCGWYSDVGAPDVFTFAVDGSDPRRVTDDPAEDWSCSWSPDGSRLAFHSLRDGDYEIYTSAPDGSDLVRLTVDEAIDQLPRWSPDGRSIAFITSRDGDMEVYVMGGDGSGPRNVSRDPSLDDGIYGIDWTPDGSAIVAASVGRPFAPGPEISTAAAFPTVAAWAAALMLVLGFALRFDPPVGTFTLSLVLVTMLLTLLGLASETLVAAVAAGIAGDALLAWWRGRLDPGRAAILGFAVPAVLLASGFLVSAWVAGSGRTIGFTVGATLLAGFVGAAVTAALVAGSPDRPEGSPGDAGTEGTPAA